MVHPNDQIIPCEDEPIRIPGKIQPFSMIICFDDSDQARITHCSQNFSDALGLSPAQILNQPLADICGQEAFDFVRLAPVDVIDQGKLRHTISLQTLSDPIQVEIHIWKSSDHNILECEPIETIQNSSLPLQTEVSHAVTRMLHNTSSTLEVCQILCDQLSQYLGFDRVVAYVFDESWNGQVIAETRMGQMPSLLNLHYPASDIPAQARELYCTKLLRYIPDTHYTPVDLVTLSTPQKPVDLSLANSRAISPIHLEYMRNMGLGSNISISIMNGNKLWGMMIAHHPTSKFIPSNLRQACLTLTELGALHIVNHLRVAQGQRQLHSIRICQKILASAMQFRELLSALKTHQEDLLDLTSAEGFCYVSSHDYYAFGKTPNQSWVREWLNWYGQQPYNDIECFDSLKNVYAKAEGIPTIASGAAVLRVQALVETYFIWFRPEVVNTITWAGDPEKPMTVTAAGKQYTPRTTFLAWKQTLHGVSMPWLPHHRLAVEELRLQLQETLLSREERIAHLSEELYLLKHAIDASPHGVVLTNPHQEDNPIVYANKGFLNMTGYSFSEIIGRNCRFLQGEDREQPFIQEIREAIAEERKVRGVLRNYRKDNSLFYNEITLAPVFSSNDQLIHFVGLQTDVTDRVQAQAHQDELEAQLQQAQKNEAIGTLAGGIAHDMNNILAPVIGYIELAKLITSTAQEKVHDHLDHALAGAERAKALVKQVLDFSRKSVADKAVIQLANILDESLDFLRKTTRSDIKIEGLIGSLPAIYADPTQIQQVFLNIAINAIESMPAGGTLKIETFQQAANQNVVEGTDPDKAYCGFTITDTGTGIDNDHLSRIFEPFYTTKPKQTSSGLGLSVAMGIVQTHGGTISVQSRPPRGSQFSVYLPITERIATEPSEQPPSEPDQIPIHLNVAIVDDETQMTTFMSSCMEALKLKHQIFNSAEAALETMQAQKFHIAFLDYSLPSMNGTTLARRLIQHDPNIKVVMCTGLGHAMPSLDDLGEQFLGVLEKPFRFQQLRDYLKGIEI